MTISELDQDHLDELRFLALESPRSMVEIYRTDLLALIEMAEELLNLKSVEKED